MNPGAMPATASPLWDLLALPAALDPDRAILRFDDRVCSLAEAEQWALAIADRLDGRPVALLDVNSHHAVLLMFACMRRGVRFVPLNYRLRAHELEGILQQAGAGKLVYGARYAETARAVADGPWGGDITEINALCADPSRSDDDGPIASTCVSVTGDIILFTSGTSSAPKPIPLDAAPLSAYVMATTPACPAETRADSLLLSMPLYHVAGIVAVLRAIFAGRCVTVLEQFDPDRWIETVRRSEVTQAFLVPTMMQRLLDVAGDRLGELKMLRTITYGGGPMPGTTIRRALEAFPDSVGFVGVYGLTEASGTVCVLDEADHRAARNGDEDALRRLSSIGRPLPDVVVEVVDDEGRPCTSGVVGEITVRGARLSSALEDTSGDGARVLMTGDLGEVDELGYVFFRGRADDMIVRGAENIAPREIETVLESCVSIKDVAVFGVPDETWGQRVVAAVVLRDPDTPLNVDALREQCRDRLAGYKWPSEFVVLDALPMTPTGKVIKREIAAGFRPA